MDRETADLRLNPVMGAGAGERQRIAKSGRSADASEHPGTAGRMSMSRRFHA